jgi:hypothetical protein
MMYFERFLLQVTVEIVITRSCSGVKDANEFSEGAKSTAHTVGPITIGHPGSQLRERPR